MERRGIKTPKRTTEIKTVWTPFEGKPQEEAYETEADELFYGGAAGGGKTDLLIGLAGTAHQKSVIFRREYPQFQEIFDRCDELYDEVGDYNGKHNRWTLDDGRLIEFGAVNNDRAKTKWQGRPHDLIAFDELPNFTEDIYTFLIAWNRSSDPTQRCRIVAAGNPPTDAEGEWIIRRWRAWLDPTYPDPAMPGELRWFATVNGEDLEVDTPEPFVVARDETGDIYYDYRPDGEPIGDEQPEDVIKPRSRTFIPARVTDNPVYMETGYISTLQGLREPLRSQLLYGDFTAGVEDAERQIIPTRWVKEAQNRWMDWVDAGKPAFTAMTGIGVDVGTGGAKNDRSAIAHCYDLVKITEVEEIWWSSPTPTVDTAARVAQLQEAARRITGGFPLAIVDTDGLGTGVYDQLVKMKKPAFAFHANYGTELTDQSGELTFANWRAAMWFLTAELLNPDNGLGVMLPDNRQLLGDLTSARWYMNSRGVMAVEDKEKIKKRIQRSPDMGDAVLMILIGPMLIEERMLSDHTHVDPNIPRIGGW